MTEARVTVGVPVFNGERYLAQTLDSILAQDLHDFEVVISDNASTDATAQICHDYMERDRRVRYVRNDENKGAAYNYSHLLELTTSQYFKWAGDDDLLEPTFLRRCVEALENDPAAVIAFPRTSIIDANGSFVCEWNDDVELLSDEPWSRLRKLTRNRNLANPCFGVMPVAAMRRSRLIEPYLSSDLPFLSGMALQGKFLEIPEQLFSRRVHDTSSVQGEVSAAYTQAWFDPRSKPPRLSSTALVLYHTAKTILESDLSVVDRIRCLATYLATWTIRRLRVRGGRFKVAVRYTLRERRRPPAPTRLIDLARETAADAEDPPQSGSFDPPLR